MRKCPDFESIPHWMALERGNAQRDHVETCPRCQSWWLEYTEFENAESSLSPDQVLASTGRLEVSRSRRTPAAQRWLAAASIILFAGGAWWSSTLTNSTAPDAWRGEVTREASVPFVIEREGLEVRVAEISAPITSLRWTWIAPDLSDLGSLDIAVPGSLNGSAFEFQVGAPPNGSRYWQIEWAEQNGSTHQGPLNPLERN